MRSDEIDKRRAGWLDDVDAGDIELDRVYLDYSQCQLMTTWRTG